jgi:hypothetical protein
MASKPVTTGNNNRKVPRTYRLAPRKIVTAQRLLGARTATEAIEMALDLVVFRRELVRGTRAMLGVRISPPDKTAR